MDHEIDIDFREPTRRELDILEKLLQGSFEGVEVLRKQVQAIKVRQIDEDGSLLLRTEFKVSAPGSQRIPVEASYSDSFNSDPLAPRVRVLLHVVNGLLNELEIYKDDGSQILKSPEADFLTVEINEGPAI